MSDTSNPSVESANTEQNTTIQPTVAEPETATVEPTEAPVKARRKRGGRSSAQKGSAFERKVGKSLSLWLTYQERGSLFSRNVGSGGAWTRADARGAEVNLPGDLAAAHPLAFDFLKHFSVEVKHNARLVLSEYLLSKTGKDFISQAISKVITQSERVGLYWMFIGKQDRRPPFLITNRETGDIAQATGVDTVHTLFNGVFVMMNFDEFLTIDPQEFINGINHKRNGVRPSLQRRPVMERRAVPPAPKPMQRRSLPL